MSAARSFMAAHAALPTDLEFELLFDSGDAEFVLGPCVPIATPTEATGMASSPTCARVHRSSGDRGRSQVQTSGQSRAEAGASAFARARVWGRIHKASTVARCATPLAKSGRDRFKLT